MSVAEQPYRVAVLDVGCFSAQLTVVDPERGSVLRPLLSHKVRLRLDRALDPGGRVTDEGVDRIAAAVSRALIALRPARVSTFVPFATSVIRDATNAGEVLDRVADLTGVRLRTLPGREEARLSYLAARNWFGWSAGPVMVLDVGGGTVELAVGEDADPLFALSLPLGARTVTRMWDAVGGTSGQLLGATGSEVVDAIRSALPVDGVPAVGFPRAVACSKVFRQLARLSGARPQRDGPFVRRRLHAADLARWIPRLAALPPRQRAQLPGISPHRAHQSLAGAVVAHALMTATGRESVEICPWSTQEGLLLTLLERTFDQPGRPHLGRWGGGRPDRFTAGSPRATEV
ncbi:exopolyphosphatase [Saccharothrix sp. S26]|uniref:Ppx/GppA phosphatase family protein n=1 Tax=Saccharothrix sp. S26 TaxID=2907215 RepID=UPI001F4258CD|nr:exopolyphosphatase [Saccharothrix sp. S26]MCE6995458.1 exopolyphosphatase [Saccharothrix sp. S26]